MLNKCPTLKKLVLFIVFCSLICTVKVLGALPNPVVQINCNSSNSALVTQNGDLWGWGYNYLGQLGDGTTENRNMPVKVQGIGKVKSVALGYAHMLVLMQNGSVYACGANKYGQLGQTGLETSNVLIQIPNLNDVVAISAGKSFNLALKSDGTV